MFTGIVHHTGRFVGLRRGKQEIGIEAPGLAEKVSTGDSVAVDGVCLTVIGRERSTMFFNLSRETLAKTTLAGLKPRAAVNLELPLTPTTLLGGHLVSGHVDFKGRVLKVIARKTGKTMAVSFPGEFRGLFVPKGSAAVNGVSLTVASLRPSFFEVELVPATLRATNLAALRAGDPVNVECDMIGKYVYNALWKEKR
ncbi:MAG: riboflavin synthase [Candidatus Aminicenantes bacterium]|nr:riboflavin synthase [Candidatus Aminicenantes bacterium]